MLAEKIMIDCPALFDGALGSEKKVNFQYFFIKIGGLLGGLLKKRPFFGPVGVRVGPQTSVGARGPW